MELQIQILEQEILSEQKQIIAISSDTLILMKNRTEMIDYLLEGNDNKALLVEGSISNIFIVIQNCYDARENNTSYSFIAEDGTKITFK